MIDFPIPFGDDRLEKPVNMRDTNYVTPPPLLSLLFLSSLSSNQRFCNVYSQAAHFRSGLVEARSMTYGDLGAKAFLSVLVVVSH